MRVAPIAAVFLAVLPAFGAPPPDTPPIAAVPARSAEGRRLAIEKTGKRIDFLVGQGKKDRYELMVDIYRGYSDVQLGAMKKGVTVENLLEIVKADGAPKELRVRAAESLYVDQRVLLMDPDLQREGKRGKSKRAEFSMKVLKLLVDNVPFQRELAKNILEGLWAGWKPANPAIKNCDPRDRDSCVKAQKEWERIIRNS